jgi:hypothetical protein
MHLENAHTDDADGVNLLMHAKADRQRWDDVYPTAKLARLTDHCRAVLEVVLDLASRRRNEPAEIAARTHPSRGEIIEGRLSPLDAVHQRLSKCAITS